MAWLFLLTSKIFLLGSLVTLKFLEKMETLKSSIFFLKISEIFVSASILPGMIFRVIYLFLSLSLLSEGLPGGTCSSGMIKLICILPIYRVIINLREINEAEILDWRFWTTGIIIFRDFG